MQADVADDKLAGLPRVATQPSSSPSAGGRLSWKARLVLAALGAFGWYWLDVRERLEHGRIVKHGPRPDDQWGSFPRKGDPFHFLPCTNATVPPSVDEPRPVEAWSRLYDADPGHWSRGNASEHSLYLCGWLDVPLDYTNASDERIARLAVTRFQHSPVRSNRTMVVEPGGPGGSGTNLVWRKAEMFSHTYTDDTMDVLGWDPRGVNASQPSISCFPFDADRDRWSLLTSRFHREADPRASMLQADAMNQAVLEACERKYGDVAAMLTTAFVARDLDRIRSALGQEELDGYFISYGTGIGQTYVNMFPHTVGRLMLDGTEYVRDQREIGGFGWAALDNITAAFHDGFLGECVDAGPDRCALAQPLPASDSPPSRADLVQAIDALFGDLVHRPLPAYTQASGPMLVTYSQLVSLIYAGLYNPFGWEAMAQGFYDLLQGNSSLIAQMLDSWEYDPTQPVPAVARHGSDELGVLVICSDQYDARLPANYDVASNGEDWYLDLWQQMVRQSEIGGNGRFFDILPCRHWNATFGAPKEVYRGDLDAKLSNPVLLIAETYDPATPLRNGRRLLAEMGENARLIAHHGYGHSSRDTSRCTNAIMRAYMLNGTLPAKPETECFADRKPYRYHDAKKSRVELLEEWTLHMAELRPLHSGPRRRRS